jgi:cytoskeletal protein RodZ
VDDASQVSKVSIASIGGKLRKAREGRSLTLDQVQKQTRIHTAILSALEDGKGEEILSSTYVKSFLKKYSEFLGLDSTDIVKDYSVYRKEKTDISGHQENIALSPTRPVGSDDDHAPKAIFVMIAIALFAVFVSSAIFAGIKAVSSAGKRQSSAKADTSKTGQKAASQSKKTTSQKASSKASQKESTPRYLASKGMLIYLVLRVDQPVFVKVKKDGVALWQRMLPKGSIESFKASEKIELYIGKAEAVELILNGKSLGSPGKGLIKNLEITKKGIRIK